MTACDKCGHLIRHHSDNGCARCDCKIPNAELEYMAVLAEPVDDERSR